MYSDISWLVLIRRSFFDFRFFRKHLLVFCQIANCDWLVLIRDAFTIFSFTLYSIALIYLREMLDTTKTNIANASQIKWYDTYILSYSTSPT
jgi:hypothetical protein